MTLYSEIGIYSCTFTMSSIEVEAVITNSVEDAVVFDFDQWSDSAGLNRKTVKFLRTEELVLPRALVLIDDKDVVMMPLSMGQRKLLKAAVIDLNAQASEHGNNKGQTTIQTEDEEISGATGGAGSNRDTTGKAPNLLEEAGKTFDNLFGGNVDLLLDRQTPETPMNVSSHQFDPRAILTIKSSKNKALHITDFLTEKTKKRRHSRRREIVLSQGTNNQDRLVMKSDEEHPYSGIQLHEWGAANARLMNALISKGILNRSDIEYYLAYTAKMFEFAAIYHWENVLDYDHQYRELQAEHGFHWGVTSPDMELRYLTQHQSGGNQNGGKGWFPRGRWNDDNRSSQQGNNQAHNTYQTQECKLFKARGTCPFGAACRYKHALQSNHNQDSQGWSVPQAKNGSM